MLYEVDTRLRPEGRHGPITMSLSGYRSYFISRASPWERQALTRARIITSSGGMEERITTCIADAVYLEAPGQILEGVADMRLRMQGESEKKYGAQQNIKTGEGGLVDAEFIAQAGQLLFGTGIPGLMGADTPAALERLGNYGTLGKGTATGLREAYEELRRVQINLRIDDDRAHNVLPVDEEAALTLARGLGFDSIANLQEHVSGVAKKMRECFLIALEELRRTAT
jgi:glutamate-ammonia-ligase adenylyltransferase